MAMLMTSSGLTSIPFGYDLVHLSNKPPEILEYAYLVYAHRTSNADAWIDKNDCCFSGESGFKYQLLLSEEILSYKSAEDFPCLDYDEPSQRRIPR